MNVTESHNLNVLFGWLLKIERAGRFPTGAEAMEAAAYLAKRSDECLHAGIRESVVRDAWLRTYRPAKARRRK